MCNSVGFQSDSEFALFDFDSYSEYHNWRRAMEIPVTEQLNLHGSPPEIEEWVERFELWCSILKGGMQNQSVPFFDVELYPLVKNLASPNVLAKLPFEKLKSLLLDHILPVDFQATERAK
ncbi:unnamed protein product [Echinostoma caproni]|uniref:SNF2_N domain-containing protein n=1 Tax=Echinostoma caproni TaxID=27848 RepID=A0A183ASL9_9TREM|nr:unnamed protein product [Echinostoma caproni]